MKPHSLLLASLAFGLLFNLNSADAQPSTVQPSRVPAPRGPALLQPVPPPNYGYYQPHIPPNYHLLSFEEQNILHAGEISPGQVVGGGLMALFVGFGTGQAVQGRWSSTGWKFALAEAAGLTALVVGIARNLSDINHSQDVSERGQTLAIAGLLTYGIAHLWEIVDVFAAPSGHNQRYRQVQWKAYGNQPYSPQYSLFVTPNNDTSGGIAGLKMSF